MGTLKLLPLAMLMTGLGILQSPLLVQSQTDYEEYIIMEDINEQEINQQNTGSGSSTNINCGANVYDDTSPQSITCPSIPGDTPTPIPGTTVMPVVTQRVANVSINPSGTTSGEAQCNPDEVVTGGGYSFSEIRSSGTGGSDGGGSLPPPTVYHRTSFKEFAQNNAWHIEIVNPNLTGTVQVYAECLKLVPA
jgi:hypothetical protein